MRASPAYTAESSTFVDTCFQAVTGYVTLRVFSRVLSAISSSLIPLTNIKDMDICLNVTRGSPVASRTVNEKSKRGNKDSAKKSIKKVQGKQVFSGATQRVKQKSLAAIVANNLKKSQLGKAPEAKKNVNEDLISFKKSPGNALTTVLAKPKPTEQKKSLAGIFSAGSSDGDSGKFVLAETSKKRQLEQEEKKPQPKKAKLDKSKPQIKIASLFGNNPEIPNIGQRLVKPINEDVFAATKSKFSDLHSFSVSNLEQNMGITEMTTVQKKAIPVILSGSDVLIRSQTGSGKTLAYALPIVELLHKIRPKLSRNSGLNALVVVPARELAQQTYECFLKLIKPFTWIVPGYLIGGEKRKAEKARLRRGCNILIATPGRLLDHLGNTKALTLNDVKYFVLDEADRMLDMGYEKDISGIVSALNGASSDSGYNALDMLRKNVQKPDEESEKIEPEEPEASDSSLPKRQTILLSATLTQAVEKLAGITMREPILVDAAKENLESVGDQTSDANEDLIVPKSVTQSYVVTPPKLRMVTLCAYVAGRCQSAGQHKIIIFMATQDMVDYHTTVMTAVLNKPTDEDDEDSEPLVDVEFFKLHGSMLQKERTDVFKTFKSSKSGVLLCTDVAARGLDLPKVDTVVQYTGPLSARDYVHRIGRTARAGSSGTAIIFLTPPEVEFVRMLESRRIRIKQEDMDAILDKLVGPLTKHSNVQAAATALQNEFESLLLEDKKLHGMACKAYSSWVRFYASYPRDMRQVFDRKLLHLGHYAKCFALRDAPQRIGGVSKVVSERTDVKKVHDNRLRNERLDVTSLKRRQDAKPDERQKNMLKNVRMLNVSEYGSGLEPVKKATKY